MSNFPRTVEEITPEWLTQVLRESGLNESTQVESVSATPLGADRGVNSEIVKLTLQYNRDPGGAPTGLIAKFVPSNKEMHAVSDQLGIYECEAGFYSELAHRLEIRTPKAFFSAFDTTDRQLLILLEDLSRFRSVDVSEDCTLDDARSALLPIAELQAKWWNSPELPSFPFLLTPDLSQSRPAPTVWTVCAW